jgi:hypothetical protein
MQPAGYGKETIPDLCFHMFKGLANLWEQVEIFFSQTVFNCPVVPASFTSNNNKSRPRLG